MYIVGLLYCEVYIVGLLYCEVSRGLVACCIQIEKRLLSYGEKNRSSCTEIFISNENYRALPFFSGRIFFIAKVFQINSGEGELLISYTLYHDYFHPPNHTFFYTFFIHFGCSIGVFNCGNFQMEPYILPYLFICDLLSKNIETYKYWYL